MGGVVAHSVQPSIPFPFSLRALEFKCPSRRPKSLQSRGGRRKVSVRFYFLSLSLTRSCLVSLLQLSTVYLLIPSNVEESVRSD